MLKITPEVGASCTPDFAETKLCPNPQCQQPFTGPALTCSFHCASAYVGFTALRDEFNSVVEDAEEMFLVVSEPHTTNTKAYANTQPTHRVTLRLVPPPPDRSEEVSFTPAAWAAANLNLLHPPRDEDYQKLRQLTIPDLKSLYQLLLSDYAHDDWPDLVWDTLSGLLERELAALSCPSCPPRAALVLGRI